MAPLFLACGQHLLPYAFPETMVARALAAMAGQSLPGGPVVLWPQDEAGRLRSVIRPAAWGATHALVQRGSRASLQPLSHTDRVPDAYHIVSATPDFSAPALLSFELPEHQLMTWATTLTALSMGGAMWRTLAMTIEHVNHRQQFNRPLAKFQAIQQQVSVAAERVACASVAARIALKRELPGPNMLDAATAKSIADDAAMLVTAVAHATHGAIGITAEHDLSLFTRRIKRWQLSYGSGGYWEKLLGEARVEFAGGSSIDFIRAHRL